MPSAAGWLTAEEQVAKWKAEEQAAKEHGLYWCTVHMRVEARNGKLCPPKSETEP